MDLDTRDLVEGCRRGDARAWDQFVDRYQRLVWSVPRSYRLPEADCDDVTQAVLLSALKHLDGLREVERLSAWLLTAAHRESWRVARGRGRTVDLVGDFASVAEPDPGRMAELETRSALRAGLDLLGDPCRALLVALFAVDDPHYPTIAQQLGMAVGSIGPTRARCIAKLKALLERPGAMPPG